MINYPNNLTIKTNSSNKQFWNYKIIKLKNQQNSQNHDAIEYLYC